MSTAGTAEAAFAAIVAEAEPRLRRSLVALRAPRPAATRWPKRALDDDAAAS